MSLIIQEMKIIFQRFVLWLQLKVDIENLAPTQLSTKFIQLVNVKMPTIVGILTFISMINSSSERLKETRSVPMNIF